MPGSVCNENHGFILGALWGLQDQLVELHLFYKQEKKGRGPCEPIEHGLGSSLLSRYLLLSYFPTVLFSERWFSHLAQASLPCHLCPNYCWFFSMAADYTLL